MTTEITLTEHIIKEAFDLLKENRRLNEKIAELEHHLNPKPECTEEETKQPSTWIDSSFLCDDDEESVYVIRGNNGNHVGQFCPKDWKEEEEK